MRMNGGKEGGRSGHKINVTKSYKGYVAVESHDRPRSEETRHVEESSVSVINGQRRRLCFN